MASSLEERGSGWIAFAGIMLIIVGVLDIVNGLWALDHKDSAGAGRRPAAVREQARDLGLDHVDLGNPRADLGLPGVRRLAVRPLDRHHRGVDCDGRQHDVDLRVPDRLTGRGAARRAGALRTRSSTAGAIVTVYSDSSTL